MTAAVEDLLFSILKIYVKVEIRINILTIMFMCTNTDKRIVNNGHLM